jgi:hypothetical protein
MNASAPSLNILVSLVIGCLTAIIFSLVHLGNFLINWVGQFENGGLWQLGTLGAIFVLSTAILSFTIRGASNGSSFTKKELLENFVTLNIQKVVCQFTSGIIEGLNTKKNQHNKSLKELK